MTKGNNPFGDYSDFITSVDDLEALSGPPMPQILAKELQELDEICSEFISKSPMCIMATANPAGYVDLSPRGDPPGFSSVLGSTLLALPDRPGNKRMDSFHNLLKDPRIGLLFFVPDRGETLRIRGTARLCRDARLLESMQVNNRAPKLALLVHVETAFMHCPKCIMRSNLWQPEKWQDASDLADMNAAMVKHAHIPVSPEEWFKKLMEEGEIDLY
ncbi:Pyridoxamine 5'-phosphate oxidase [Roseovarius albus]|uniref:Pyridoxamine 5'-phosphate oxidase n=1 Tax=Roseovarius albus TaxID=1247867 RepID=A0A1X6ZB51_9RHOB|nr:MSMEG_1061 family FMN-dependent PPOX-type flavoprotein [Roseovarius albus]SLN44274.1 Pyridoxamine 5'-phosphate oxidase [Roseovarius albus]